MDAQEDGAAAGARAQRPGPPLEQVRSRLVLTVLGFVVIFSAVAGKLFDAMVLHPLRPPPPRPVATLPPPPQHPVWTGRARIEDRWGHILAVSLPSVSVYADPRQIADPAGAARRLAQALPGQVDAARLGRELASPHRSFVWVARQISPRQELAVNNLGIPGVNFMPTEMRRYPLSNVAAQILGGVDVDGHGIAGVEKYFDKRLRSDPTPLHLSLDVRVQAVMRDELERAVQEFDPLGAAGIVMDAHTGEVLAMVSLPDYDANDLGSASANARFNRAVTGDYEPGSTFKLETAAMALDDGLIHVWNAFDTTHPLHIGRFTIHDYEPMHRWLYLPEVIAYSSNIGAARIADMAGKQRQRAWLRKMGLFDREPIQLPEAAEPIVQDKARWRRLTTMTVGFGHGIAETPLHIVTTTAMLVNGGWRLRPTLLALPPGFHPTQRVMQPSTSGTIRRLMRLVVTEGSGKLAKVPGYFVGGKTGTAEKVGPNGRYLHHQNVAAFVAAFPMNAPRYVVYVMVDDPHGDRSTGGFTTGGEISAPVVGRVIARIGPMLDVPPETDDAAQVREALALPLHPNAPPGVSVRIPEDARDVPDQSASRTQAGREATGRG